MYAYMARMYNNEKVIVEILVEFAIYQLDFRFSIKVSYVATGFVCIPGSLKDMDKHIEVTDGHHVMTKQKG